MPTLSRPDGVDLHWEEAGEGPGVLVCNMFNRAPLDGLVACLAEERRVITYDQRGLGRSGVGGPYDLDTSVTDLEALLEEAGPVEVALGMGDGAHRAIRAAAKRPDLIDRVVFTSTGLGRAPDGDETAGFAGSTEVLSALMGLLRRDYRSGLRSMVSGSGGFGTEEDARERVEGLAAEIPQDAAIGYLEAWIAAGSTREARDLGRRLTVLAYRGNDWFPLSMYESMRDYLTQACFELIEDGPINRPDLTAGVLMRVSEPAKG
jgi:pimeloyl-ACP methyl ester carboxylesterase